MNMRFPTFEPLLAAWSDLGSRFSGRHAEIHWGDIATLVGVIVGGLGFVAVLYVMQRRQQQRAISNEPVHLFQDLCQAHDLSCELQFNRPAQVGATPFWARRRAPSGKGNQRQKCEP